MTWVFRIACILIAILTAMVSIRSYILLKTRKTQRANEELKIAIAEATEEIKAEKDKTEDAYQQLKKLEKFKKELTGMIVHDLKNPLVTILGYSAEEEIKHKSKLKYIHRSGNTMLSLIENMLEIQKFEEAAVKLEVKSKSLMEVVDDALEEMKYQLEEKRIDLQIKIDGSHTIMVDKETLIRVFTNLLSNAIKFSPVGNKVEIFEVHTAGEENLLTIGIGDEGEGMTAETLEGIFDRYTQGQARDSGSIRSTGLGLTFCKLAIEAHGGRIWAESEPGKGSTFYFCLPRSKDLSIPISRRQSEADQRKAPLHSLQLDEKDVALLSEFIPQIKKLKIFETGEWLELFEKLNHGETENLALWTNLMWEAITSFDEEAFRHLQALVRPPSTLEAL